MVYKTLSMWTSTFSRLFVLVKNSHGPFLLQNRVSCIGPPRFLVHTEYWSLSGLIRRMRNLSRESWTLLNWKTSHVEYENLRIWPSGNSQHIGTRDNRTTGTVSIHLRSFQMQAFTTSSPSCTREQRPKEQTAEGLWWEFRILDNYYTKAGHRCMSSHHFSFFATFG